MQKDRTEFQAMAMLGLVMLLWAGNSIVARAVRFDVPPFTLAFLRWGSALLLVAPFAAKSVIRDWAEIVKGWKWLLALGILGVGVFNAALYSGLQYTTATNALLLQAGIPPAVLLLDRLFFGTRAHALQVAGVVFSTLGVMAIVFEGNPAALMRLHFGIGDAMVLIGVAAWAFYTVLLRKRPPIGPRSFIAVTFAVGMLAMVPLAASEWHAGRFVHWNAGVAGAIVYVALFSSLVSYFIYNWAAGRIGPARAGQAITLLPLFGALLSAAILGESLLPYHWAGMALILVGIVAGSFGAKKEVGAGAK
ncbi:DMT family transporter [Erythrobacter sp. SG61-1L]|uniref:DMT family transporter n=1 Tax=Erythrobacter sp. SG61-1L TaxID=1603897 RepID=UPI0006C8EBFA|nr:DMT family transporter [Erythrobacter sp. SG61-1L]